MNYFIPVCLLALASTVQADVIENGDFSSGTAAFTSSATFVASGPMDPGEYSVRSDPSAANSLWCGGDHTTGTGDYLMVDGTEGSETIAWEQTVQLPPGRQYRFGAWLKNLWCTGDYNDPHIELRINGSSVASMVLPGSSGTWVYLEGGSFISSPVPTVFQIVSTSTAYIGNDFGIDDICLVDGTITFGQVEDFELYADNSPIEGQGSWHFWNTCAMGNQAINTVSSALASSGANSLRLVGSGGACAACSDSVYEMNGPYTSGQYTIAMNLFIPANFSGEAYVIALNTYSDCGGPYDWSAQVHIDNQGIVGPDNLQNNVLINGDQPVVYNAWVELKMEIDLDANSVVYSYNDVEMYSADWTTAGVREIAALDFFPGTDTTTEWFVDNISVAPGISTGPIGTNYCFANPNSTGSTSVMSAAGSAGIANNDLTLIASGLPLHSYGFFITGPASGFVPNPGGNAGNLCLGGSIGRYTAPGQIRNSGVSGEIDLSIDNTMVPTPLGPVALSVGETRFFQLWHRDSDASGPTSNFTDGLEVTFN